MIFTAMLVIVVVSVITGEYRNCLRVENAVRRRRGNHAMPRNDRVKYD